MAKSPARRNAPRIAVINGTATTTSRDIAETFGKRHDHVLERIRKLDCSLDFRGPNFRETFREVPGPNGAIRKEIEYQITRDGFAFLCMGFTGARAAQWKEKYIDTFNRMADKLAHRVATPARVAKPAPTAQSLRIEHDSKGITPDMAAAINARAMVILSSALPSIHAWLTDYVRKGCIAPGGGPAPNFENTLVACDFAAFSTNWAINRLDSAIHLAEFAHTETARALANVQAERTRLAAKGRTA